MVSAGYTAGGGSRMRRTTIAAVGLLTASLASAAPPGWEILRIEGGIEVARMNRPGSSLYGFRGSGEVALPIGVL
ncbi:MAG: hypothetical protein ACI8S6_005811, partial [Myxococcota bacterium]